MWANFVEAADELESLFDYGPSVTAVLGADGIGKSRLLDYLQQESEQSTIIRIEGNPLLSVEQVMSSISAQLMRLMSLQPTDKVEQISEQIHQIAQHHPVIFLVDDAHHLSLELTKVLLSLLGKIEQAPELPIRLFAFMANRFNDTLVLNQTGMVDKQSLYKLSLSGFAHSEMTAFLGHQLNLSEEDIENNLGEKKLRSLWEASMGNSAKLQTALKNFLIKPKKSKRRNFLFNALNFGDSNLYFRLGLATLGIALLAIAFWGSHSRSPDRKAISITKPESLDKPSQPTSSIRVMDAQPEKTELNKRQQFESQQQDQNNISNLDESSDDSETLETLTQHPDQAQLGQEDLELADKNEIKSSVDDDPVFLEETTQDAETFESSLKTAKEISESKLTDNVQVTAPTAVVLFPKTKDESWLLAQEPAHYAIQLVGLRDKKEMEQFIRAISEIEELHFYQSSLQDKPWYILVQGNYINADQARKAIKNLPQRLIKNKPWIKSLKVIQAQMATKK